MPIIPKKLHKGDEVRIVSPSKSLQLVNKPILDKMVEFFAAKGLTVSFGKHVYDKDTFSSSSVSARIHDLHEAFRDDSVKAVFTAIGGTSANQLLRHIDYSIIKDNPKIFCGLSDITCLLNAIYAKTGLVTYSGPHAPLFGATSCADYTWQYFEKCVMQNNPFLVTSSKRYCDHRWDNETLKTREYWPINTGVAAGIALGGNLLTLNFLQGSQYMPSLKNSIMFVEDNDKETVRDFQNHLQSLLHQKDSGGIKGIIIGRFQKKSQMTRKLLSRIVLSHKALEHVPVLANVDFGHTTPMITIPIGGKIQLSVKKVSYKLNILKH